MYFILALDGNDKAICCCCCSHYYYHYCYYLNGKLNIKTESARYDGVFIEAGNEQPISEAILKFTTVNNETIYTAHLKILSKRVLIE